MFPLLFRYYRKPKLPKSLIFDRRTLPQALSTDEKIKHQHFCQRYHDEVKRIKVSFSLKNSFLFCSKVEEISLMFLHLMIYEF
jgi:hypothetical protein